MLKIIASCTRDPLTYLNLMKNFLLLALFFIVTPFARSQISLPWHHEEASHRTAFLIEAPVTMCNPAITLSVPAFTGALALVDAQLPYAPLPIYDRGTNGITCVLPGMLKPGHPRTLVAYSGSHVASKRLDQAPPFLCDYALNETGYPWDFENGTPCGITSWGNRPSHIGPISIKDGWLQIPVKDTDPYFIFGNMFGNAPHPRDLHINSSLYRFLELRVRQSCSFASWEFFVTDHAGRYQSLVFDVHGTEAQTFRFDLQASFRDFWDGREFRALRIDTTNNKRDLLAEVDYVRLLPTQPAVVSGPVFSRAAVIARDAITEIAPSFPRDVTAGKSAAVSIRTFGTDGRRLVAAPVIWTLLTHEHGTTFVESAPDGKTAATFPLPAFTRTGECALTLGLAGDLGQPIHAFSGKLEVRPAALASYRLTPDKAFIDVKDPSVRLTIQGLDAFGNCLPVNVRKPRWTLPANVEVPAGRIRGNPATVLISCRDKMPTRYPLTFTDDKGLYGATEVATIAYRSDTVRLNGNGYLVTPGGTLYFPAGGLYANWPHRLNPDGSIDRSLDLFPCGPLPYKEGFPWREETERAVGAYLRHCSDRGINCLRLMLRNMDLVGRVDPVQLQATLHLFDLARPYGIRFNVALFEDYDKPPYVSRTILEKIVLPLYKPEQLRGLAPHRARFLLKKETLASAALRYSDPDAIACQRDYLRELIPVLAAREEVLCYEFENEMVYPAMAWCAETAAFIRTIDPHTLILGNPGPHNWPEPLRWRNSGCDLYSFHPYNDGQAAADHGAVIHLRSKWSAQSGLPMYTGEGGLNQNRWQNDVKKVAPELAARGTRDQIWMSVCCGATGCLYWTLMHDFEALEFDKIKPALEATGVDLPRLKRPRASVALLHAPVQRDPRDAAMTMRLLDLGVDFDTVATNEASVYAVRIDLGTQTPESITLPATVAAPAKGWQVATLLAEKHDQALLYLRNVAGGVNDVGAPPRPCFLRAVKPAEAAFTLRETWRKIIVYDLDSRKAKAVTPDAAGRISLGVTSHDFLIGCVR